MDSRVSVAVFATVSVALHILAMSAAPSKLFAQGGSPAPAQRPGMLRERLEQSRPTVPSAPALKPEQQTRDQFDRLPDAQELDVRGSRMTAGEIRMKMRQARAEDEAKAKQAEAEAQAGFEAYRAKFLQEQKAKRDAQNAKAQAEVARLRQQGGTPGQQTAPPMKGSQQPQRPEQLPQPPVKTPQRPRPVWK